MLQTTDFRYNFFAFKWIFWLPWYPFKFKEEGQNSGNGGQLCIYPENHWRHKTWTAYKILLVLHCLFICGRALQSLLLAIGDSDSGSENLDLFPYVLVACVAFLVTTFFSLVQFSGRKELNVKLFNELFSPQTQHQNQSESTAKNGVENPGAGNKTNFLVLIIRYFPFCIYSLLWFYPFFYIFLPDLCILLISPVDDSQRNFFTVGVCLFLDILAQLGAVFAGQFFVVTVLTFILRFLDRVQKEQAEIQKFRQLKGIEARLGFRSPFFVYKSLTELNLLNSLFNLLFSDFFFLIKTLCLVSSIGNGFSAIRVIGRKPVLGLVYLNGMVTSTLVAVGIFDTAYKITSKTEELKQECRLCSQKLVFGIKRKENRMRVRAIPRMGIQIGGFYCVEREATPIFLNYVVSQISSLLITFP